MTSTSDLYSSLVEALLRREVDRHDSLEELCGAVHGLYPIDARDRLKVLYERLPASAVASRPASYRDLSVWQSRLPIPHPLDFEWRFAPTTAQDFLHRLTTTDCRKVAMLGTPALAEHAQRWGSGVAVTLVEMRPDACTAVTEGVVDVHCDDVYGFACGSDPGYDTVIADPPWYPEVTERFLYAAARLLKPGGELLLASPGLATRPGIVDERLRAATFAQQHGLAWSEMSVGALVYESPPFELAALAAGGLAGFDPYWRRGDLMVFTQTGPAGSFAPRQLPDGGPKWHEVAVGDSRIRVLEGPRGATPLERIVQGDVLDSVSSRDSRRGTASVWTSTNRIFATSDPTRLVEAISACAARSTGANSDFERAAQWLIATESDALHALRTLP